MANQEKVENYLLVSSGPSATAMFRRNVENEQRVGQAFMNTLWSFLPDQYSYLQSSRYNPFYVEANIPGAIELLIQKFKK